MKVLFSKGQGEGFAPIALLIVVLIVGVLAAVATRLYLGSVKSGASPDATSTDATMAEAKTAEAKMVAGALWTTLQANAAGTCGTASAVSSAYRATGVTSEGATTPARWRVPSGAATLLVDCATGAYTASSPTLFVISQKLSPRGFSKPFHHPEGSGRSLFTASRVLRARPVLADGGFPARGAARRGP